MLGPWIFILHSCQEKEKQKNKFSFHCAGILKGSWPQGWAGQAQGCSQQVSIVRVHLVGDPRMRPFWPGRSCWARQCSHAKQTLDPCFQGLTFSVCLCALRVS